jgi:hypothetical protein
MKKSLTKIVLAVVAIMSLISTPTVFAVSNNTTPALYEIAIAGRISSISANTLVVQGTNGSNYNVNVTGVKPTIYGHAFVYGSLMVNDQVVITGQLASSNQITADSLNITVKVPTFVTANGQIINLTNDAITVLANDGTNYNVVKANASVTINGQASNLSMLNAGDLITFNGVLVGVNKVSAGSINVNTSAVLKTIYGKVVSVDTTGKNISLQFNNGVVYTVYAGSASIALNSKLIALTDISRGDQINVTGQWLDGSNFLAKTVVITAQHTNERGHRHSHSR